MLSGTVLLLLFLVLMFMGIPVAHSMIITAYITIKFIHPEIPTIIVAQRLFGGRTTTSCSVSRSSSWRAT